MNEERTVSYGNASSTPFPEIFMLNIRQGLFYSEQYLNFLVFLSQIICKTDSLE